MHLVSRRTFLETSAAVGGGLLLGFTLPPLAPLQQNGPFVPNAFVRIDRDGRVTLIMHKVEMGQGTYTSMPMLLAEELEVDLSQVQLEHAPPDDARYAEPLFGVQETGGSTSVRGNWEPLRRAGATARSLLVAAAAQTWKVDPGSCHAAEGQVIHGPTGRSLNYGALVATAAALPLPRHVTLKDPKDFKLIGTPAKRLDAPDKVNGTAQYGIDVKVPGMKVATVAACPVFGGKVASVNDAKAKGIKGVQQVVRLDDAVAVVADHMWAAKQGLAALDIRWDEGPNAKLSTADIVQQLAAASEKAGVVARNEGDASKALAGAVRKVEAVYEVPFLAHATMEPVNCTVHVRPDGCDIWVGTQVPTFTQTAAAKLTGLPRDKVRVHNHLLGGGFGRRLEVDFVIRAVQIARQVASPVKVVWTREEDIQHDMKLSTTKMSFMDELAAAARRDPVAYRLALLDKSPRARGVLELAAQQAGWGQPLPAGHGRGVSLLHAFGSYIAQVAEVSVSKTGDVRVHRVVCAVDCGTIVNPDTVKAQMESGIIFGITAALFGEITIKDGRVEQSNFNNYRMLRINEVPVIDVHLVKSGEAPGGIGEPGTSAVMPALANAIFEATGKRIRKLPVKDQLSISGA